MSNGSVSAFGGLVLVLLIVSMPSVAQQRSGKIRQSTRGVCSPAIVDNNGQIIINCGVANEEMVKLLNKLVAKESTSNELLLSLNKMRSLLQKMDAERDDPRKELARIGLSWTNDSFLETVLRGDMRALRLFFAGGMSPYSPYENGYSIAENGHAIAHLIWKGKNADYAAEVLDLFIKHGLDVDRKFRFPGKVSAEGGGAMTLAEHAIEAHNANGFRSIWNASHDRDRIRAYLKRRIEAKYIMGGVFDEDVALQKMLLIAEPDAPFEVVAHKIGYAVDPVSSWYIAPKATSLVKSFTYEIAGQRETTPGRSPRIRLGLNKAYVSVKVEAVDLLDRKLGPIKIDIDLARAGRQLVRERLVSGGGYRLDGSMGKRTNLLYFQAKMGPLPKQMRVDLQELLMYAAAIQSLSVAVFKGDALVGRVPIDFKRPGDEAVVRAGGIASFQEDTWYMVPWGDNLMLEITLDDDVVMKCRCQFTSKGFFVMENPPCRSSGG